MAKNHPHENDSKGHKAAEGSDNQAAETPVNPAAINAPAPGVTSEGAATAAAETPAAPVGKPEDGGLTNPNQIAAYHKHETIAWETKEEAELAAQITLYAFGKNPKHAKTLKGADAEELEVIRKVAAKLELDSFFTDEAIEAL